jgi:hypothetical protein
MTTCQSRTRPDPPTAGHGAHSVALAVVGAVMAIAGCGASSRAGSEPSASSTAAPPSSIAGTVELDALAAALLDAEALGVPPDWAVRDIDAGDLADADVSADTDPFLGLLQCPDGTIREEGDRVWLARKYTAPEVPLENGLLWVEIIVEVESADDWNEDRAALDECTVPEQAEFDVSSTTLLVAATSVAAPSSTDAGELEAATLQLLASPTAAVPYPSAFNATTVHVDGRTITVVLGGIDLGQSWQGIADDITVTAIDSLRST